MNEFVYQDYLDDFEKEIKRKNIARNITNIPKLVKMKANKMLKDMIIDLAKDPETKEYARMLKLEIEYTRKKELEHITQLIELRTGMPAGGVYSDAEIARVLGLSRERIRQIGDSILSTNRGGRCSGILTHNENARVLRDYKYKG